MQDTLERILVNLHSLPDNAIKIVDYARKHNVKGTLQDDLEYFKDIEIEDAFNVYETIESLVFGRVWEALDDKYKKSIDETSQRGLLELFKQMSGRSEPGDLPAFEIFCTALNRLAARCLSFAEVPDGTSLSDLLKKRPDVWPYQYPNIKIESLSVPLGNLQVMHVHSLFTLTVEFSRPQARQPTLNQ